MIYKAMWIDHQQAYIFEFQNKKVIEKYFAKKTDTKLIESSQKFAHAKEHQKVFYHNIALELGEPDKLLLLGPGVAREEFKHHCEFHHHEELAKRIISSMPMKSHPRKSEILKVSRNYFDKEITI